MTARAETTRGEAAPAGTGPDVVAPPSTSIRADRRVLTGLCLLVFSVYSTFAWVRHVRFQTTNYDLGIFDQAIRAYSRFQAPIVPLKAPGYDLLGDHFHPLIAVLAPLYWIWDDPRMLLLAQAALFAASMVPVARFAERRLGGRRALVVAFVYGLSWPLQRAVLFDFHEIAFAVPLIAAVIDAIDRRAWRWVVVCCLLLLAVREDMGAIVVLAGVLVALRSPRRRENLLVGGGLVLAGVAGYWVATSLVIPALAPTGTFAYWTFPALGPDPASAVRLALTQPWRVLQLLVTPAVKAHTLLVLVLPTLFLAVFSPYVVLTLPFIAERMLNSRSQLWETGYHYSSVLAPTLVMAAVDTASKIARRLDVRRPGWRLGWLRPVDAWLAWCVGFLAVVHVLHWPDYPVARLATAGFWQEHPREQAIARVLRKIPPDQCVEAANQLGPHLTTRDYVTQPTQSRGLATWVVLDMSQQETGWQIPPPKEALAQTLRSGFTYVDVDDPIVLLHKDRPVLPICRTH